MVDAAVVLLYPSCIFFEIALAAETLAQCGMTVRYLTPDGAAHDASNGARIASDGPFAALEAQPACRVVLVPGGDPRAVVLPQPGGAPLASAALVAAHEAGALIGSICAGNLVVAASGLLRGRRGTHNYSAEFADAAKVAATRPYWEGMTYVRADVVTDGRIITAQHWAYRGLAAEVAFAAGVMDRAAADALRHPPPRWAEAG